MSNKVSLAVATIFATIILFFITREDICLLAIYGQVGILIYGCIKDASFEKHGDVLKDIFR